MKFFNKKNLFIVGFVILLSIPLIFPLFHNGFFVTDDGEWAIIRLSAFFQALRDGQFPVRYIERLNFGYGYPVSTFLYPGYMYLGSLIHLFKISYVDTVKIILGMSLVGSAIFTYFWLKKFFNDGASIVGAIFYIYSPYHLYDLYVRGSVGEMVALTVLPFILWQIERKSKFWISIGIALLMLSHNTLAALFLALIICYMLLDVFVQKKKNIFYSFLISIFLGFGLAAFFWVPILFELKYTVFLSTQVSNWKEHFAQVDLIGYSTFIVLFFTLFLFISKKESVRKHRLTVFLFIVGIASIFLSSSISNSLWEVMPVSFIQFPFRFLSVSLVSIAFLAAFVTSRLKSRFKIIFIFLCLILLYVSTYKYISAINFFDKEDGFYSTNEATTTVQDEYMPVWVKEKPLKRPDIKIEIIDGEEAIEDIIYNNRKVTFIADLKNNSIVQVNSIYWPGWIASIDEKQVPISYNNPKGVMRLNVPTGRHLVELKFGETPIRLVSDGISFVSIVGIVILLVTRNKNNKKS